jgi:hypothetical protein
MKSHSWDMILFMPLSILFWYYLFIRPFIKDINFEMLTILVTYVSCLLSFLYVIKLYNKPNKKKK